MLSVTGDGCPCPLRHNKYGDQEEAVTWVPINQTVDNVAEIMNFTMLAKNFDEEQFHWLEKQIFY